MCFRLIPEFLDAMMSFDRYARRRRPDQWRGTRSIRQRVSSATRDIPPTGQKIYKHPRVSNRLGTDVSVSNGTVEVPRATPGIAVLARAIYIRCTTSLRRRPFEGGLASHPPHRSSGGERAEKCPRDPLTDGRGAR